ncbi:assimilatory sulfite reductase (NADPH) flavoprotein subunit [Patulibacter sp.]|uniref:assimilatory sulfite reductase (NADPH) flavoprotein subunit n=1 Tax=Patulibacter sp. TaxID=1912859 RepID=UPI0027161E6E|nr:assimilatory sulfite reductase (NADPH) flavoprotein subunit [Patulibacter sp.]MDO9408842.1 assimilatory sulfite reductase (NADPH) flavoprotein subunit [Patulibacter sp.]
MPPSAPTLTPDQLEPLGRLAGSLDRDQAIWLSGYFAGLAGTGTASPATVGTPADGAATNGATADGALVAPPAPAGPAARQLTVLFGTDTGNAKELAGELQTAAKGVGIEATVADLSSYKPRALKDEQDVLVVMATHGEGDPPPNAVGFFEFLAGRKAPKLDGVRFSVLALGDSTYEHYCSAGRIVDERFAELGAERIADRVDCDVDYEDDAAAWIADVVGRLTPEAASATPAGAAAPSAGATATASSTAHSKKHPFAAPVLENVALTGRGSTKETRHVELSLEDSGLTFEPGDALGVVPENDPALVDTLLERLSLSPDTEVTTKQGPAPLREALTRTFEITAATPRFLEQWAELSGSSELQALKDGDAKARTAFFYEHHVLDFVDRFPVAGIEAGQFVKGLRPLQPRLYSIASSLAAAPDEAHLTVSTVQYDLHESGRTGVASGHLARLLHEDATVPVYVQSNEHFRLPAEDDVPIIMVGAGTGVAPYRAFMQEREARGAQGRSWLVFGERNFRTDFLYQVEWQQLLKDGTLTKLDPVFSRDSVPGAASAPKTYVQHRLREKGAEVWDWLQDGARIYVCGDANAMAPDVHTALAEIAVEHGGLDREAAHEHLNELQRDHRYLLDVY